MQRNELKREGSEENVFENRSQDETEGEREKIKDKGKQNMHKYLLIISGFVKTPLCANIVR